MMREKYQYYLRSSIRFLVLMTLFVIPSSSLTSCDDDEPNLDVGYYLGIQSQVRLSLYEDDESQGTSASPVADPLSTTIIRMRAALRDAYPMPNTHGNDSRVIAALDDIFMDYKTTHHASERNTVCIVKLYRTRMENDIVKKSKTLKTYHFGAIPPGTDESGS
jgi:hypothetical protein